MPVRVGFLGAGGMASTHMNALQAVEDVRISAVADIVRERAEAAASRFLARAYPDLDEMLSGEKLDALYVCVPPFAHADHELTAINRGLHLFVEKPVALGLDPAREVRDAVEARGVVSAVGYHWRYQSNTDRAIEILKGRTIAMISGYWMGGFPQVSWWRRMDESGGQMVEQATHIFDLARFLCGEIVEVFSYQANRTMTRVPDFDIADVGVAAVRFESGIVGTISNTCILDVPYRVGLHIVAENLVLEIHGDLKVIEPGHTETFTGGCNPILEENRAFIEAIRSGDSSAIRSTYADAVKTLAATLACNESAMTGRAVVAHD